MALVGCGQGPASCSGVCVTPKLSRLDLLAGQPGGPGAVDGTLVAAHFADPWTMARADDGRIFVADGNTLRTIDPTAGTVTTLAGSFGVSGGTDGPAAMATFNTPSGLVYSNGMLYLTDTENHTIRSIDSATNVVTTIGGVYRQPGAIDAVGTAARFQEPEGLALDAAGNLYIGDTDNDTIRVMSLATGAVTTLAGDSFVSGNDDGVGGAAHFAKPKDVLVDDSGHLYVCDNANLSVRKIEIATATVSTLAVFTAAPQGLALDGNTLYASLSDHRLVQLDATTGAVTPIAGTSGVMGFVDAAGADARFNSPAGLLLDGGTLYVADELNAAIRAVTLADDSVTTFAGALSRGSRDGSGSAARFFAPHGLASDATTVYVADTNNDTIRAVALAGGAVTTIAGAAGQLGSSDGTGGSARFSAPQAIALDAAGKKLYVADTGNALLRRIDLADKSVTTLRPVRVAGDPFTHFDTPAGMAFVGGTLYVSDYAVHAIFAVDVATSSLTTVAGMPGMPGGVDGPGTKARFYGPLGLSSDGAGDLFVADNLNDTVREIELAGGNVTTLAGTSQSLGDNDGTGAAALFYYPSDVAADGAGDVYVAASFNNRVRHIDVKTKVVTTVIGSMTLSGVKLGPLPAQLTLPAALTLTPTGMLVVVSEDALLLAH